MKKIICIACLFFHSLIHAQTHLHWSTAEVTPGSQINDFKGMATDAHGNTYTINFTQNSSNYWFTYRFFCYNSNGVKMWQYNNDSCFTNCQDIYKNIIPLDNNGAIFIGTYNDLGGNYQVRMKRIDLNGNLLWQKNWAFPTLSPLMPIVATLDHAGNIVMGMSSFHPVDGENFAFAKFDTIAGNELWHFELPDQGPPGIEIYETMNDIAVDANNNIYIAGTGGNALASIFRKYYFSISPAGVMNYFGFTTYAPFINGADKLCMDGSQYFYRLINFNNDVVVFKQDTTGGFFQWTVPIQHDSANIDVLALLTDSTNLYVVSNFHYFFPDSSFAGGMWNNKHYCVTKIDTAGNTLWQKDYFTQHDSLSFDENVGGVRGITMCNGNLYIASDGFADSSNFTMILHKIDSAGNTVWYDTTTTGGAGPIFADSNCDIYTARNVQNNVTNWYVLTLVQKFSDVPLLIKEPTELLNDELVVYPNPAHDAFTIRIKSTKNIKEEQAVHLYNSMGQQVYKSTFTASEHMVSLKNLANGIYVVTVKTGNEPTLRKNLVVNK